ncbi:MAG: hypothetical protein EPO26_01320 [Chloroflexota bacterium]|nr:MAG: hypothetical protein EPO26_01320 [Chloroflexota bacterium]
MRWPVVAFAVATLVTAFSSGSARADVSARETRFVYGLNLFTGTEYTGTFAPPSVDTIYVLADETAVLDPKRTEIYFWPLTNEYRPDWTALSELVPGTLEVTPRGGVPRPIELTDYVVQFDRARGIGNGRISLGDQANADRAAFERERAEYLEELRVYTDGVERLTREMEAARQRPAPAAPPAPLAEPPAFTLFSTDLARGFPVKLSPGEYAIQVRSSDGTIVPDSARRLVAIAARRQGVGYEVVPQAKWTYPERSSDPSNTIYTAPSGVIYLQPFHAVEFNALEYARLQNPQDLQATANRWTWVHVSPIEGGSLRVGGETLRAAEYVVEQLPGAALGYSVVPLQRRPDEPPVGTPGSRSVDLVAFRVESPPGRASTAVRLVDSAGREIPGSARQISAIPGTPDWQLGLTFVLPIAVGVTAVAWGRERAQRVSSLAPEQRRLIA